MQLSRKAKEELKAILRQEIGEEGFRQFTDEGINDLGARLLHLTALCLKERAEKLREWKENKGGKLPSSLARK